MKEANPPKIKGIPYDCIRRKCYKMQIERKLEVVWEEDIREGHMKFWGTVDMFPISTMVISREYIYNVKTIVHLKYIFLLCAN